MRNDLTGRWGEETAAAYLRCRHYTIVAANYRCRLGEIDLIAENRDYLVFVEVKLRKSAAFAEALEFVDRHKQERIRRRLGEPDARLAQDQRTKIFHHFFRHVMAIRSNPGARHFLFFVCHF